MGYLNARFYFRHPVAFKLFYASWRLSGGDPGSGAETLADSPSGPLEDQESAGARAAAPASVARVPELGVGGALCADLSPLQRVKTRILGEDGPCFLFSLVPPPNLSDTFENKILFVSPPIITQLWTVDVQCLMARRAGRGWWRVGRGARRGAGRSCREQFAGGLLFSGRFHPSSDAEREDLGAGCGDGGGGPIRGLPAYFPEAPCAEGEGRQAGGRGRDGWVGVETRIAGPTLSTLLANWERAQKRVEPAL